MFKVTDKSGKLTQEEINECIFHMKKRFGTILPEHIELILDVDGDDITITYDPPFEFKAYRGTDYLVNDAQKLNDSKLAELREKTTNEI